MLGKINPVTVVLVGILILVIISFASLWGFIQFEHIHYDFAGKAPEADYLILRFQNNPKVPYEAFECQHSDRYFLIRCSFSTVL